MAERHAYDYWAFLSYAHADAKAAEKLHSDLETFKVPKALVGKPHPLGRIPEKLAPIFRDRQELAASADLGGTIRGSLDASRYLIVLCSPAAVDSKWVDQEIRDFKKLHGEERVLAAIVDGEPFASDIEGQERLECFPAALRFHVDHNGELTADRAEPVAADLRDAGDGWRTGMLKIAAGMLGVGLDALVQREHARRQKRLKIIAAASIAGMMFTSGMAAVAIDARDTARDERREAEGLVAFMLGDLREELEPIGRLDALDKVGERALSYFEKQDRTVLTDEQLAQRSSALALLGEIALQRGDLDGAAERYTESIRGSAELIQRDPGNPQRLFDHAQNVFWVGELATRRGQLDQAEKAFRQYERLADRMVALEPDNRDWQMEVNYANANLGVVMYMQRRYSDAAEKFDRALSLMEKVAASEPDNRDFQKNLGESLAWLADAEYGAGQLAEAIAKRERQVAMLQRLVENTQDADARGRLLPARAALGKFLVANGAIGAGTEELRRAIAIGERLSRTEPDNMRWKSKLAVTHFNLARALIESGKSAEGASAVRAACELSNELRAREPGDADWHAYSITCLLERARLALKAGSSNEALSLAQRAIPSARELARSGHADGRFLLPEAHKLKGDAHARLGERDAANRAWRAALRTWPERLGQSPSERALHAEVLAAAGRADQAREVLRALREQGYRIRI